MCRATRSESAGTTAGFTMIEALVAIAVVAVVLSSIGGLMATTTRGIGSLEQHVVLMETARTVAASLRSREPLPSGGLSGEMYGNRWRIGTAPMVDSPIMPDPRSTWIPQLMTIRVQSPSGAVIDIKTVRLQRKQQ